MIGEGVGGFAGSIGWSRAGVWALWRSETIPHSRPKLTTLEPVFPLVIKEAMEKMQKWMLVKTYNNNHSELKKIFSIYYF